MKRFFVYMLHCGDGSYYVGHTDKKEALIRQDWAELKRLARGRDRSDREEVPAHARAPFDSAPGAVAPPDPGAGRDAQGERRGRGRDRHG